MSAETDRRLAIVNAAGQLDWVVGTITEEPPREGNLPNGLVMFERGTYPFKGKAWGTARWAQRADGEVYFYSGEYDLTRAQARTDLKERI